MQELDSNVAPIRIAAAIIQNERGPELHAKAVEVEKSPAIALELLITCHV